MKSIRAIHIQPLRFATGLVLSALRPLAAADERPQVDLSIRVGMTPATFIPGGHNLFSVTVRNAGPDDAGTASINEKPIHVYGSSIIFPPTQPAALEILEVTEGGCWLDRWSESLPNGNWVVQFTYSFAPIAAGESHTCVSDVAFSTSTTADVVTNWRVDSPRDDDIHPDDNRFDYTFVAAPPAAPASVPARSFLVLACLALALLLTGGATLRRASMK